MNVGDLVRVPDGFNPDGSPRPWPIAKVLRITEPIKESGTVWCQVQFVETDTLQMIPRSGLRPLPPSAGC